MTQLSAHLASSDSFQNPCVYRSEHRMNKGRQVGMFTEVSIACTQSSVTEPENVFQCNCNIIFIFCDSVLKGHSWALSPHSNGEPVNEYSRVCVSTCIPRIVMS